ncbi:ADP-ribosyltransferase [Nocardia sp. NPDC050406]|uniref:ADP-ribosyltransferase n=1 Tax=Nocardia sp. NPDC050406 TaxID=3364318 RepID=UPI0037A9D020
MALKFPSWLEWLEWVVGSDWPHGNEDLMWQMGRDFEAVAKQVDQLIDDVGQLINQVGDAYPAGTGAEQTLQWLTPLRDGTGAEKNGSLTEFADNYRNLGKAADGHGDALQAAKLNFYIAGAWLIAELAWAAASGPFAPALQSAILATARIVFRKISQKLGMRIAMLTMRHMTPNVLKRITPKLIWEIGQEAIQETLQGTSQEMLVQTIQKNQGHIDKYDWDAIKKNAAISAFAGGVGGGVGFGMNSILPTAGGKLQGALNGALTGSVAGAAGALAAWAGSGFGEFDPRSLTGGALSGAGPGAVRGYFGQSEFNVTQPGPAVDGSGPSPRQPGNPDTTAPTNNPTTGNPDTGAQSPGANTQSPDNATQSPGANTQSPGANTQSPDTTTQSPGATTQSPDGGPQIAPAAATEFGGDHAPTADTNTDTSATDAPTTNTDNTGAPVDTRNAKPEGSPDASVGGTETTTQGPSDTTTSTSEKPGSTTEGNPANAPDSPAGIPGTDTTTTAQPAGVATSNGNPATTTPAASPSAAPSASPSTATAAMSPKSAAPVGATPSTTTPNNTRAANPTPATDPAGTRAGVPSVDGSTPVPTANTGTTSRAAIDSTTTAHPSGLHTASTGVEAPSTETTASTEQQTAQSIPADADAVPVTPAPATPKPSTPAPSTTGKPSNQDSADTETESESDTDAKPDTDTDTTPARTDGPQPLSSDPDARFDQILEQIQKIAAAYQNPTPSARTELAHLRRDFARTLRQLGIHPNGTPVPGMQVSASDQKLAELLTQEKYRFLHYTTLDLAIASGLITPGENTPAEQNSPQSDQDTTTTPTQASPEDGSRADSDLVRSEGSLHDQSSGPDGDRGRPPAGRPDQSTRDAPGRKDQGDSQSPRHRSTDLEDGSDPDPVADRRDESDQTVGRDDSDQPGLTPGSPRQSGGSPHPRNGENAEPGPQRATLAPDSLQTIDTPEERSTASPVRDFHGDARPSNLPDLTREQVLDQIRTNGKFLIFDNIAWNPSTQQFEITVNGETVAVALTVGPTTDNAVAEFHQRPDGSGYDVTLSSRARDQDVLRAIAHELVEIQLRENPGPDVDIDPVTERPTRMTTHLGGRFAELDYLILRMRMATVTRDPANELPGIREDLAGLIDHLGFTDPDYATTIRSLLDNFDSRLASELENAMVDRDLQPVLEALEPVVTPEPDVQPAEDVEPATDHEPPIEFEDAEAGYDYGARVLAPLRDDLTQEQRDQVRKYTQGSKINEFLRHPDRAALLAEMAELNQLMRQHPDLFENPFAPTTLPNLVEQLKQPDVDPTLRAAIESVFNAPDPSTALQELVRKARKWDEMHKYFGARPTEELLDKQQAALDQATDRPIPRAIRVCRNINSAGLQALVDSLGNPFGGGDPRLLKNTEQTERAYMSTSLSPYALFPGNVRMEIDLPAGTPGLWIGNDLSESPGENEFLLAKGVQYRITDVVLRPGGPGYLGIHVLLKCEVILPETEVSDRLDDRPDTLTPHLINRFEQMGDLVDQLAEAYQNPARTAELPHLRREFGALLETLGLFDPAHSHIPYQLLEQHDPELFGIIQDNYKLLLPTAADLATEQQTPAQQPSTDQPTTHPEQDALDLANAPTVELPIVTPEVTAPQPDAALANAPTVKLDLAAMDIPTQQPTPPATEAPKPSAPDQQPGSQLSQPTTTPPTSSSVDPAQPEHTSPAENTPTTPSVLHGPDRTAIGSGPDIARVYQNLRNEGAHDVILHTDEFGRPIDSHGRPLTVEQVIEAVRNNPNYESGTPIRLISCHSGSDIGWAQQIADALGSPVLAPTDLVGVRNAPDSPATVSNDAPWRIFQPTQQDGTTPQPRPWVPTQQPGGPLPVDAETRTDWDTLADPPPDTENSDDGRQPDTDRSTAPEFDAHLDEVLASHPDPASILTDIDGTTTVASIADRMGITDPEQRQALQDVFEAARDNAAPFIVKVASDMLANLKAAVAANPDLKVVFLGRDGHSLAMAMSQLDPEFFARHGHEVTLSRALVETAVQDLEKNAGLDASDVEGFRNTKGKVDPESVDGAFARLTAYFQELGIPIGEPGSDVALVDTSYKGTVQELLNAIFPETTFQGHFMFYAASPVDPHPDNKLGYALDLDVENGNNGYPVSEMPADPARTFQQQDALGSIEEIFHGPLGSPKSIGLEGRPSQELQRFETDPLVGLNPANVSDRFSDPLVREAAKRVALLPIAQIAHDIAARRAAGFDVDADLQAGYDNYVDQVRAWVGGDPAVNPKFAEVMDSFVRRADKAEVKALAKLIDQAGLDSEEADQVWREYSDSGATLADKKAFVEQFANTHPNPAREISLPSEGNPDNGPEKRVNPEEVRELPQAPDTNTPDQGVPSDSAVDGDQTLDPLSDSAIDPPVQHAPDRTAIGDSPEVQRAFRNVRNDGAHDVVVHGNRFGSPTADGNAEITPQQVIDAIRNNPHYVPGTPIRLLCCFSGMDIGFAQQIADALGVPVLAPTDAVGVRSTPNSPAVIPENGNWKVFRPAMPDGTTPAPTIHNPAQEADGPLPQQHENRDGWDVLGHEQTPDKNALDPDAQAVRDAARLRTGGRDALAPDSPARELTGTDVDRIERIEGLREDLNRPGVDPAAVKAKLRTELEKAGVLRKRKEVLRNDGPAMQRRALLTEAGLDIDALADEIGLRRPSPARTDNEGLPLRGEHADADAVPRRDVTFAEVDAIVPRKLIQALEKFGVSREVAVEYIVDNHNDRSRQRYLPDLEGLARQYGIPQGDVLVIDLYTTKLYYEELNRRLREEQDVDSVDELRQAVIESLSKLPPVVVPELFRSLSIDPSDLPDFLAKHTKGAVIDWNAFTSVAGEVGGTWWGQPGENILFTIRGGVAYDISDFADGLHYKDPPNPGRELLLPAGKVVRVENVTPYVFRDGTTGYVIDLEIVGSAGPASTATP